MLFFNRSPYVQVYSSLTNQQTKAVEMNLESNSSLNEEEKSFRQVAMVAKFLGDNNRKRRLKNVYRPFAIVGHVINFL